MGFVVKAKKDKRGIVVHEFDDGGKKEYLAVRGGISWPCMDEGLPAYYCFLGEEWLDIMRFEGEEERRGKLCLIKEFEAPDIRTPLDAVFSGIVADARLYACETFYGLKELLKGEDYSGYAVAFQKHMYEKKSQCVLEQAPWAEMPALGVHHMQSWAGKGLLDLPEGSLALSQLKMLESGKVSRLPQEFNAVNALRYAVCGFEKDKPTRYNPDWRDKLTRGTWRSGMGR